MTRLVQVMVSRKCWMQKFSPKYKQQEAMENFVFPDNLQCMVIFLSNGNISEYSALQNVQFSNWDGRQSTEAINIRNIFKMLRKFCQKAARYLTSPISLYLCTLFNSIFKGQDVGLSCCKYCHFHHMLMDFHVQKVSSGLSKWFLHTPRTTKGCQTGYFKDRQL